MDKTTVRLSVADKDELNELLGRLETEEGRSATQEQLVGALLHGTSPAQAEGMLRAYIRSTTSDTPHS
jgi:hypothetical protein